jgi:hypothetical protein
MVLLLRLQITTQSPNLEEKHGIKDSRIVDDEARIQQWSVAGIIVINFTIDVGLKVFLATV